MIRKKCGLLCFSHFFIVDTLICHWPKYCIFQSKSILITTTFILDNYLLGLTCRQVSHLYGFSPLCVLLCLSMWYFCIKRMLHWSQLNGFSPVKKKEKNLSTILIFTSDKYRTKVNTHHCGFSHAVAADTSVWSSYYTDCTWKASHLYNKKQIHFAFHQKHPINTVWAWMSPL